MKRSIAILALLVSGCATYQPIIDMQGVDPYRYPVDLQECQAYARQVSPAGEAVAGAAIGAALGAALGAIVGDAGRGAALGGTMGVASGGASGLEGQMNVIRACMNGRGYRVLR